MSSAHLQTATLCANPLDDCQARINTACTYNRIVIVEVNGIYFRRGTIPGADWQIESVTLKVSCAHVKMAVSLKVTSPVCGDSHHLV